MQEVLIGEYMKNHREAHGMTQSELCAGICDPSTLSRLERGRPPAGTPSTRFCTVWACRRTVFSCW